MGDDSSKSIVKSLKKEWSLLIEAFQGEEDDPEGELEIYDKGKIEVISRDEMRELTKELTENRKRINQQLEYLSKQIEESSARFEGLNLVGGDTSETENRIQELNDLGLNLTEALSKIDKKLRDVRDKEMDFMDSQP